MRRLLTFVAACSFVLAAVPAFAQSQATTAEINGRVTDAQGGVLPGATRDGHQQRHGLHPLGRHQR